MKLPGPLAKLTEEQHQVLIGMLSLGKTDSEMTDSIIEQGWLPDVKPATLLRNVNRWRKGKGQEAVFKNLADHMQSAPGKMKRQIDVLEELTTLVLKQKKRVQKMAIKEDDSPLLLQSVTDETMRLVQMLEKLGKFQLDTGLLRRVRVGEVEGDYVDVAEEEAGETAEVYTEEDRRLLAIVQSTVIPLLEQQR